MEIWRFIQDQILGMKWLNELIGAGHSTSGLDAGGGGSEGAFGFFLCYVLKITVLLCFLIFIIS